MSLTVEVSLQHTRKNVLKCNNKSTLKQKNIKLFVFDIFPL